MRYYVYKTTNLINSKEYIGVHKSININRDKYIGSGKLIRKAIQRYGHENFSREILGEFETYEEAFELEKQLVTDEFVKLDTNYNIAPGGIGGMGRIPCTPEMRLLISKMSKINIAKLTPEQRKARGIKSGEMQRGRTKFTHDHLRQSGIKHSDRFKNDPMLRHFISTQMKNLWATQREKMMIAREKTSVKLRGRTKYNDAGRLSQSIKIKANNPMARQDVLLEHFIGKTKENCEWRARQALTIKATQAAFSPERKAEIYAKISAGVSGVNNGMYGMTGELSPVSKYTDEQRNQACQLFSQGLSRKQISSQLSVHYQTIKIWLRGLT